MQERLSVFWHPGCLVHDTGSGAFEAPPSPLLEVSEPHPESAARIQNILAILQRGPLAPFLAWNGGRPASRDELLRFHEATYLDRLATVDVEGETRLTPTTVLKPGGWDAARIAAGTAIEAADCVLCGRSRRAYALIRPPGHHAAPAVADGYCFLNNAALAAAHALAAGLERVAIIDWDVHHGNGTQAGFYASDAVLTVSLHMDHGAWGPSHPQTGAADEIGEGRGRGFNLNIPLSMGTSDRGYLRAFDKLVLPEVERFRPQLIIVATGFDASQFDPNGRQTMSMSGFHALGNAVRALSDRMCEGRLLLVQEGGYNVSYTAFCAYACLEGVVGRELSLSDPLGFLPDRSPNIDADIANVKSVRRRLLDMVAS